MSVIQVIVVVVVLKDLKQKKDSSMPKVDCTFLKLQIGVYKSKISKTIQKKTFVMATPSYTNVVNFTKTIMVYPNLEITKERFNKQNNNYPTTKGKGKRSRHIVKISKRPLHLDGHMQGKR